MNNSNDELLNRIIKDEPPASSKEEQLRKALARWFDGRRNAVSIAMGLQLLVSLILLLVGASLLMSAHDVRLMLAGLAALLFGLSLNLLVKLWYWILDSKLGVLKELKLMQLSLLERSGDGDDTEMDEGRLEQLLPEEFRKKPGSFLGRLKPKTIRLITVVAVTVTATVATVFTVAPAARTFGMQLSANKVSQEDEWLFDASDAVTVRSEVTFTRGPVHDRFVTFALPHANAELISVTADGVPLPHSKTDWRRYEAELPVPGFGESGPNVLVEWTFPMSALKAEGDGLRTVLCSLLPVTRYQLDVVVAPDSGFQMAEGFRAETDASGAERFRPYRGSLRQPNLLHGSCGLCIERKKE
jgi:hypothetical protein